MKGGAIPLLAWATILLVLFIGNAIWDDQLVNAAEAGGAALIIYLGGLLLWVRRREALRRGPPEPRAERLAAPGASTGAVVAGLSVACILFGVVWARFLVWFGAAVLVLALGRLVLELRSERESLRRGTGAEEGTS